MEKARKAAETENYVSTDEMQLGKGYRKKVLNKTIYSDSESDTEESLRQVKKKLKKTQINIPQWPCSKYPCTDKNSDISNERFELLPANPSNDENG